MASVWLVLSLIRGGRRNEEVDPSRSWAQEKRLTSSLCGVAGKCWRKKAFRWW